MFVVVMEWPDLPAPTVDLVSPGPTANPVRPEPRVLPVLRAPMVIKAQMELPAGVSNSPMTYMINGKQYIAVAVGAQGVPAQLVALALP